MCAIHKQYVLAELAAIKILLLEFPFLGGALKVVERREVMTTYDGDPPICETEFFVQIGEHKIVISELKELYYLAEKEKYNLGQLIEQIPVKFALLCSYFLGKGRLITDVTLYRFLEDEFEINISNSFPRVEQGILMFTILGNKEFGVFILYEVQLSIQTLEYKIVTVKRKEV